MSERGVVAIDRGIFDHECFADEPFTEREAWCWLISEAAWKERTRRIGRVVVSLERGQLAAAVRFMAERWGWSKSKVGRFLDRLKNRDMIETKSETGISVITIRNYNTYQRVSLPSGTDTGTQGGTEAGQKRDKREDIKYIKTPEAKASGGRPKPATRLPEDWTLSENDLGFARGVLPESQVASEVDKFRDYWRASNGPPKRDWSAAWRNWCRKAAEMLNRRNFSHGRPEANIDRSASAGADRVLERLAQLGGATRRD